MRIVWTAVIGGKHRETVLAVWPSRSYVRARRLVRFPP